jgi:hypothetical protein
MEQGLLGVALFLAPAARAAWRLRARGTATAALAAALLITGMSFWFAVGYRDVPLGTALGVMALGPPRLRPRRDAQAMVPQGAAA